MRRGIGLIWLGATAVVTSLVGVFSYQAGWAAGLAAKLPEGAPAYYYAPHPFGFGFFSFLFLLFVLLMVFRVGRRWGPGGWGPRGWGQGRPAAGQTPPPPTQDPWHGWPERPPGEQPPSGPQQA
jgi:hypothetical protein